MSKSVSDPSAKVPLCPRCQTTDHARRKLIVVDPDINSSPEPSDPACGHLVIATPGCWVEEQLFLNGFYCDACGVGYVSESNLRDVGLTEGDVMDLGIQIYIEHNLRRL